MCEEDELFRLRVELSSKTDCKLRVRE